MAQQQLQRLLGKGFSIATCVGLIVGLGILRTPGEIAATISNPKIYMMLWVGGGLFTLLTVLTAAEMFAMTPRSGGVYALVRRAYSPYPGFLIGWTDWSASCAAGAFKAVVAAEYIVLLFEDLAPQKTIIALIITTSFASLQMAGIRLGSRFQQTAVVGFGFIMIGLTAALFIAYLTNGSAGENVAAVPDDVIPLAKYGIVAAAVVFTYDGLFAPTYFSGEMKSGPRAVAEGAIRGVLIVIAFYILLNLALVLAVPLSSLVGHDLALAGAIDIAYGKGSGTIIVIAALFILLAHQNLQYMNASRTIYALSVDGLGTERATSVSDKGTPTGAVIFTWVGMASLVLAGGFELLLSLTTFLIILTYVAVIVGIFRMRRSAPDADRPYLAWGYPYVSGAVGVVWACIAAFVGYTNHLSVVSAIGLVMLSAPAYLWLKRQRALS